MKATVISPAAARLGRFAIRGFGLRNPVHTLSARAIGESERASPHLTPRQLEVLASLCEGLPNKMIARRLNISAATVKVHIGSILRELGVASRLQAAIAARARGLVPGLSAPTGSGYSVQTQCTALS